MQKNKRTYKEFVPLIVFYVIIGLITIFHQRSVGFTMMGALLDIMGWYFILFGALKVIGFTNFVETYLTYNILAQKIPLYAYCYPFIECSIGILYILGFNSILLNAVTFIIMIADAVSVSRALQVDQVMQCACMGTLFNIRLTFVSFIEDVIMAAMALFMVFLQLNK